MPPHFTNSIVIFLILLKWVTPSLKISFGSFKTRVKRGSTCETNSLLPGMLCCWVGTAAKLGCWVSWRTIIIAATPMNYIEWVRRDKNKHQITDFVGFEKTYYSHLIGMRSPMSIFFEFIIADYKHRSRNLIYWWQCHNIETAADLGFRQGCTKPTPTLIFW